MNTVKIGDKFENLCFRLIEQAVKKGQLGIDGSKAKFFRKKAYYSRDRGGNIIFDLAIEIWPPDAKRYTLLFLIECKSSNSKKVPVDDVEEFYTKVTQVSGLNAKAIMISDNSFQSGGVTFATNKGMMLIEAKQYDDYKIILHKTKSQPDIEKAVNPIDETVSQFLLKTLTPSKILGLERLSSKDIEARATKFRYDLGLDLSVIKSSNLISLIEKKYNLRFDLNSSLESVNGKKILGYFNMKERLIYIDCSMVDTLKFNFILGHELGHFVLHENLKFNQSGYNSMNDSEYDFFLDKHVFLNDKNWLEWQANKFSSAFFLNEKSFKTLFLNYRKSEGIRRPEHVYLDNQPANVNDFQKTLAFLSSNFEMSIATIKYRLEEMNLITYTKRPKRLGTDLRSAFGLHFE